MGMSATCRQAVMLRCPVAVAGAAKISPNRPVTSLNVPPRGGTLFGGTGPLGVRETFAAVRMPPDVRHVLGVGSGLGPVFLQTPVGPTGEGHKDTPGQNDPDSHIGNK